MDPAQQELPSIGATLRAARMRLGWSPVQAAERLHLDSQIVDALEAERFDSLGAPVYVRGHLRRYAELLGLPAAELEQRYQVVTASGAPDLTTITTRTAQLAQHYTKLEPRGMIGLAAALCVIAVVWYSLSRERSPVSDEPPGIDSVAPAVAENAVSAAADSLAPMAAAGVAPSASPVVPTNIAPGQATPRTVAPSSAAPAPAPAPRGRNITVQVRFHAASPVLIVDASGKVLLDQSADAGASMEVRGRAPLRFTVGDPGAIGLIADGRGLFLSAGLRESPGASFTLDQNGRIIE